MLITSFSTVLVKAHISSLFFEWSTCLHGYSPRNMVTDWTHREYYWRLTSMWLTSGHVGSKDQHRACGGPTPRAVRNDADMHMCRVPFMSRTRMSFVTPNHDLHALKPKYLHFDEIFGTGFNRSSHLITFATTRGENFVKTTVISVPVCP